MKKLILTGLASVATLSAALGTEPSYINDFVRIFPPGAPPVIDATIFVNNVAFIDNTFNSLFLMPFATANTVNYTNFGVLSALEGFRFDTFNTQTARYTNAGTFCNAGGAIINCGGTNEGPYFSANNLSFFFSGNGSLCLVTATNIINRGNIEMGPNSLLKLQGQNVLLSGGLLNMEGFETGNIFGSSGRFDGYWGAGQTAFPYDPMFTFSSFFLTSPAFGETNRYYTATTNSLFMPLATAYLNTNSFQGPSNFVWQVVFLQNTNPAMSNNVYFPFESVVEWVWTTTNAVTGLAQTNYMYLEDFIRGNPTVGLRTNGVAAPSTGRRPSFIPTNYFFSQSLSPFFSGPAAPGLPFGIIGPNTNITSDYTAYEALFVPTTSIVSDIAGQSYTNMPGRVEITADNQLDLRSSRIASLNYLQLNAKTHFTLDRNTRILTPVADFNLSVTNSTLTFSNLVAASCPRLSGFVDVFSTRWTNVDAASITNTYYITMVDSHISGTSPATVQNLALHATNVVISDVLTVLSNLLIDAVNVTITTNGAGAQTPAGELHFPVGKVLDASAFPRLVNLTNNGAITVQNSAVFGTPAQPYGNFINHGSVTALGCSIWATNVESTGLIDSGPGPINLTASTAVLRDGVFNAPFNNINLGADSLVISNQTLRAGHNLTILATNTLTDGVTDGLSSSGNIWTAGVLGFNLPSEPPIATLLGTTITDTAPDWASVVCQWAGQDRGPVASGYSNNAGLGRLILDAGFNGTFVLSGPTVTNALYVDYIEFRGAMTNFDSSGNLANLSFAPGMKVYYAQLIVNGVSFAEKLNGKNDGGLNWVPTYAGAFSSTNMVYPDGTTNRLNLALVQSCDLDSNNNGIANCMDPAPVTIPAAAQFTLTAVLTNQPHQAVVLSWESVPHSTNSIYFKPSMTSAKWQLLTNFVVGATGGRQRVTDPLGVGGRLYRLRIDALSP